MNNDSGNGGGETTVATFFAPAEREDQAQVEATSRVVAESPLFRAVLDSIDGYLMILNPQRQALAVNQQLLKDLNIESVACLIGRRPGEILNCIHAAEGPGGCGTSKTCATCGAVISILASQNDGRPVTGECLATVRHGDLLESHEFRVRATPIRVGHHDFTVLVLHDISGDKRREALERTFFHDIFNTIGGLMGWSSLMSSVDNVDPKETATRILRLSRRLKQEIEDHRRLSQAESGSLEVLKEQVSVRDVLDALQSVFQAHDAARDKNLAIADVHPNEKIHTDRSLLERVLINMVKNALEAIHEGETVRVEYERRDGQCVFSVHNPGAIPGEVALRIFKRSFSTKSPKGRGIGTYSMKLFGERYLGGKVSFETSNENGAVFRIALPEHE